MNNGERCEEPGMGYAEHNDTANVEATRAFLAFGSVYPDAIPDPVADTLPRTGANVRPPVGANDLPRAGANDLPRAADRFAGYERFTSEDKARPEGRPFAQQLYRLRPDRLVLAGGSLAAAAAVAIAFATAGGSATLPPRTAATHAAVPACVSPASGR
jgi:hypothetical protein